jgi:rhamnosyltransferase
MPKPPTPEPGEEPARVVAIICTYRAEPALLHELLAVVVPQVATICVVDDGTSAAELPALRACVAAATAGRPGLRLVECGSNRGLAAALNTGIDIAREAGATHCLLLDQDSRPADNMVAALLAAENAALAHGLPLAGVGPLLPEVPRRELAVDDGSPVPGLRPVELLITSGSLIRLAVFDRIGVMDESLFIDNVDLDWSFRAHALGLATCVAEAATMRHRIGEQRRLAGGMVVAVHTPDRLYYMMRNRMRLYARPHVPRQWVARDLPRLLGKFALFSLLVSPRAANAAAMLQGIWHALCARGGRRC